MSIKRLIGAKVVNGKVNDKGKIEYLLLQKDNRLYILKPKRCSDTLVCEEMTKRELMLVLLTNLICFVAGWYAGAGI